MKSLAQYQSILNNLKSEQAREIDKIKKDAAVVLAAKLDKMTSLTEYVARLESSKDLTQVEHDEYFHRWIRFDAGQFIDIESELEKELFEAYMRDNHCVDVDFKNDVISQSEGPCLLINEDGDVLDQDSQKWVIQRRDYIDENETENCTTLNELIEKHMQKTGYFPSVIRCDRYGNAFYVNTQGGQ
jgi:hypothetical protein